MRRLRYTGVLLSIGLLAALVGATGALGAAPTYGPPMPRALGDRPNEVSGTQWHVVYMLPSDGADQALDTNGSLVNSVSAIQRWMWKQSGWRGFRLDTFQGALDITFFRSPNTTAFYNDVEWHRRLRDDLTAAGFTAPNTKYAVYFGGDITIEPGVCGIAQHGGRFAFMRVVNSSNPSGCGRAAGFAGAGSTARGFELIMTHEIFHALGASPTCAPNGFGHVNDSTDDLLYFALNAARYDFVALDVGRDDYFRHSNFNCPDVDRSPYLAPSTPTRFAADFNADGKDEIAVYRPSNGFWYVQGGAFTQWGDVNDVPVPADYDADPEDEIAVWRPSNGFWYVRDGLFTQWGAPEDTPVPGDYDGNGKEEIAVWRPSNGFWYVQGGASTQWGDVNDIPVVGDYDADPAEEIAVWRPSTGTWWIHGSPPVQWGFAGDVPVPGDYNGDGKDEIAVWRPSNGFWYVRGGLTVQWGGTNDVPLAGNFDADLAQDITVWRPENGFWYQLEGAATQWGMSGDIP